MAQCLARAHELTPVSDSPRLDAELLLAEALGQTRTWLYTWPEKHLTPEQLDAFDRAMVRRGAGEPVAHILGRREFWSLSLRVDASTLIPRPDTELLVEVALDSLPSGKPGTLLDLGTGTGAVALALAHECPNWRVSGLDVSPRAIDLAERNRRDLDLTNVDFLVSDWFTALDAGRRFDLILSNPPYIAPDDPHLHEGDLRHEPASALVADKQGMADLEKIILAAPQWLKPGGKLLLEHGWNQGGPVRDCLRQAGYKEISTHSDLSGRERVSCGLAP